MDDNEADGKPGADQVARGDQPKKNKKPRMAGEGFGYGMGGKAKGGEEQGFNGLGMNMDNMFGSNMDRDDPFHSRCVCVFMQVCVNLPCVRPCLVLTASCGMPTRYYWKSTYDKITHGGVWSCPWACGAMYRSSHAHGTLLTLEANLETMLKPLGETC